MSSPFQCCLRVALGALALTAFDAALASAASAQRERPAPVIELDPMDVDGRAHGPGTFYVVNRSVLPYSAVVQRPSFVPKIIASVAREPF